MSAAGDGLRARKGGQSYARRTQEARQGQLQGPHSCLSDASQGRAPMLQAFRQGWGRRAPGAANALPGSQNHEHGFEYPGQLVHEFRHQAAGKPCIESNCIHLLEPSTKTCVRRPSSIVIIHMFFV